MISDILRVDHAGEVRAVRIYKAQLIAARWRCPDLEPWLRRTLADEIDHVRRFRSLMPPRRVRPCYTVWLWSLGGAVLGLLTGLAGRQAIFICTEAVERTVHGHMADQADWLRDFDPEAADVLQDIQAQEAEHLHSAVVGRRPSGAVGKALNRLVSGSTNLVVLLSTQGASLRVGRLTRNHQQSSAPAS